MQVDYTLRSFRWVQLNCKHILRSIGSRYVADYQSSWALDRKTIPCRKLDEIFILVSVRYPMYSSAPSLLIKKSTSFNGSLPETEKFQRRYTMGVFSRTLKGLSTSMVMVTLPAASVNKNVYTCSVKERLKYVENKHQELQFLSSAYLIMNNKGAWRLFPFNLGRKQSNSPRKSLTLGVLDKTVPTSRLLLSKIATRANHQLAKLQNVSINFCTNVRFSFRGTSKVPHTIDSGSFQESNLWTILKPSRFFCNH